MSKHSDNPNDPEALRRRIAELQGKLAAAEAQSEARKKITTQGGAAIEGSVEVKKGSFIGRDFIQILNQVVQRGEDRDEARSVIAAYLHALASDLAGLKLTEIDSAAAQAGQSPLQLADIYVPLDTTLRIPEKSSLQDWLTQTRKRQADEFEGRTESRPVAALEALAAHRRLTILGNPGSGKSTFGASVLLTLAQVWRGHAAEIEKLGNGWPHGAPLPVRVILRRFAEQLPPAKKKCAPGICGISSRAI